MRFKTCGHAEGFNCDCPKQMVSCPICGQHFPKGETCGCGARFQKEEDVFNAWKLFRLMNATDIRGYAYNAALHCAECTHAAMLANTFTREPPLKTETDQNGIAYDLIDSEGNPVSPLFADQGMSDDTCDDCGEELP